TPVRILAITAEMPFPPIGGGLLRTYHWLHALSAEHEVTLVAFTFEQENYSPPPFPLKVIAVPWKIPPLYCEMESTDLAKADRAFRTLRDEVSEPWYASYFESTLATAAVRKEVAQG